MYAKLHKYEDVEKAAFEAISRHVKFILEGARLKNLIKDHPEEVANLMVNHCACMGTRLKTLIKDHPEEIANLMVNINKNMQQNLDGVAGAGGHGGNNTFPSLVKQNKRLELYRERQERHEREHEISMEAQIKQHREETSKLLKKFMENNKK